MPNRRISYRYAAKTSADTAGANVRGGTVASEPHVRADLPAVPSTPGDPGEPRYHGLDAFRAATMLKVVALHAALAYTRFPVPSLIWLVQDPSAHPAFDLFCWWSIGISSPFFLLSGFFARQLYSTRGTRAFVENRLRRILVPFVASVLVVLPVTYLVWSSGWMASGRCTFKEFRRIRFHDPVLGHSIYGPVHLWSLEFLLIFLAVFLVLIELQRRLGWRGSGISRCLDHAGRLIASPWRPCSWHCRRA